MWPRARYLRTQGWRGPGWMGWRPPGPWTHVGLLEVPAGAEATGWQNLCIWPLWWEVALRGLRVSSEPPGPCCLGLGRASGCRVTAEREPRTSSRTCWDVPRACPVPSTSPCAEPGDGLACLPLGAGPWAHSSRWFDQAGPSPMTCRLRAGPRGWHHHLGSRRPC